MFLMHLAYVKEIFCNRMTFQCIFRSPLFHIILCHEEKKWIWGGKVFA